MGLHPLYLWKRWSEDGADAPAASGRCQQRRAGTAGRHITARCTRQWCCHNVPLASVQVNLGSVRCNWQRVVTSGHAQLCSWRLTVRSIIAQVPARQCSTQLRQRPQHNYVGRACPTLVYSSQHHTPVAAATRLAVFAEQKQPVGGAPGCSSVWAYSAQHWCIGGDPKHRP